MRKVIKGILASFLSALLLFGQAAPVLALELQEGVEEPLGGAESYTIYDSEIASLTVTAGFLHERLHSTTGGTCTVTLGPDEEGLSLVATPTEVKYPPILEIFLDGSNEVFDTLTPGIPSRFIPLEVGQMRTVRLVSTAQNSSGQNPVTEYTMTIHRTSTRFRWTVEDMVETAGGTVLPVTLSAPTGLEIKTLRFALGFDPAKLQLCTADGVVSTELYDFLPFVEGFHYVKRPQSGYFQEQGAPTADNAGGRLSVQFGAATTLDTAYRVEEGKERLFTIYFKVLDPGFDPDTLTVLQDEDLEPISGFVVTEKFGEQYLISQCPDMAEVVGLPARVVTHRVTLPVESHSGGTLIVQPRQEVFSDGDMLTLTAVPEQGHTFDHWEFGNTGLTGSDAKLLVVVDRDMDLSKLIPVFIKSSTLPAADGVDREAPYTGDRLLVMSGTKSTALQTRSAETSRFSELDVDKNGLTVLDYHDDGTGSEGASNNYAATLTEPSVYAVGARTTFKTRNLTGEGGSWIDKKFILKSAENSINLWVAADDQMKVTDAQFAELAQSFDKSLSYLKQSCGTVYDRNGNEKLDVLLYDIQDGYGADSNSYVAGLVSYAELYGGQGSRGAVGNNADVVHLDTYPAMGLNPEKPDISTLCATMAHETQHLVSYSVNSDWKKEQRNAVIAAANPPDWLNEGLSMAVEHELFGVRSSRIYTFNNSPLIKNGYSLTDWGNRLEDYALSYLFMEYLLTQAGRAGQNGFLGQFYTNYTTGAEAQVLALTQGLPQFSDMSFQDLVTSFYAALYLQQDAGVYGFGGVDAFRSVRPQVAAQIPASLPLASGVYTTLNGEYTPAQGSDFTHLGLTAPEIVLSATADRGGTVIRNPSKTSYNRGEYVTVTAVPDEGYLFTGWTGDVLLGAAGDTVISLLMDSSKSVHATFARDSSSQEPTPAPVELADIFGGGTAEVSSDKRTATLKDADRNEAVLTAGDVTTLVEGTPITLTAAPAEGKRFLYWEKSILPTDGESFSIEGDDTHLAANPLVTQAGTGVRYTAVFGAGEADSAPKLGVLEPSTPVERRLVYLNTEGKRGFGFQPEVYDYELHLLPEETRAELIVRTDRTVTGITVTGADNVSLPLEPKDSGEYVRTWTESGKVPLTLTLAEGKDSGTVTLTLTDAANVTRRYTVTLLRVSESPSVVISQQGAGITAAVEHAEFYTVSFALDVPTGTFSSLADVKDQLGALPTGLTYSKAVVSETSNGQQLKVTIDTENSTAYAGTFVISLFSGALSDVTISAGMDNSISDNRFGALYGTTRIEGSATVQGSLVAFDPKSEVTVQVWSGTNFETKISEAAAVDAAVGTGRFEAGFSVAVPQNTVCKLVFRKQGHVPYTVILDSGTGRTIVEQLYMACGDVNEDGRIDFEDKFRLTGTGYGEASAPNDPYPRDLNGDGYVDAWDLNLLTGQRHYGASIQSQWLDLRSG